VKDNVDYLPIWKKGATAEERLMELALVARKHPERFNRLLVIYQEDKADTSTVTRYTCNGGTTAELLGLMTMAEWEIMDVVR
jgi:hypothetical protein